MLLERIYHNISLLIMLIINSIFIFPAQALDFKLNAASSGLPHMNGKLENAGYLYVTAGNRLYCIGNQAGEFPKVGFHVPGQMGGVWQHPIKLLDGYSLNVKNKLTRETYENISDSFITYSFATKFNYHVRDQQVRITQTQFVPDNLPVLVVEYSVQNTSGQSRDIELEVKTDINLMPVWLGERSGMTDHTDTLDRYDRQNSIVYFRDQGNSWYTGIGFENHQIQFNGIKKTTYQDNGITGVTALTYQIPSGRSVSFRFYVSGSTASTNEIAANISYVRDHLSTLFFDKKKRYKKMENTAEVKIPDTLLETAYQWGKYSSDWLVRDVPGLGNGMSAGLPDYPWFFSNDQAGTFMALTGTRQPDLFFHSFRMLKQISDSVNEHSGRIIHEVSTNGVVYDKGRMEESQLHIIAAWQIFNWTGDMDFLKTNYAYALKIWDWLQQHDTNHNGYIEGYGGVEIEGLNDEMLDVQVNTFKFLEILGKMAFIFNDPAKADEYTQKAARLKDQINKDWWIESENRYADFITTRDKALKIIEDAMIKRVHTGRNEWAGEKLKVLKDQVMNNTYPYQGYVVYYNASGLQPMEEGMTDTLRAIKMLKGATFFTNSFGEYIAGIERPDDVTVDEKRVHKDSIFTYYRAVMPGATAGLAMAAVRYGMPDTALMYIHKILNSFSFATPGTTYEVSPDYGMFVQAWNVTGINIPLIQYFFGIQPEAFKKEITIQLQMPTSWEYATLNNLIVGNTRFSVQYKKKNYVITCSIHSTEPGWNIHFKVSNDVKSIQLNKQTVELSSNEQIELKGTDNEIEYTVNR